MSDEKPPLKLDLACGRNKQPGFHGVDVVQVEGVDTVLDLLHFCWDQEPMKHWPWESDSVDEIFCSHFIEHIPHRAFGDSGPDPFFMFFDEIWRVLKVGKTAKIIAPYYSSMRAWQDPTHTRAISDATFLYLNKGWRVANKLEHYAVSCDFDFVTAYEVPNEWMARAEPAKLFSFAHYCNTVNDIIVTLTKRAP